MSFRILASLFSLVSLVACQRAQTRDSAPAAPVPTVTAPPPAGVSDPQQTLDRLDPRTAVPLLPMMANHQKVNMRDHLLVVQEIMAALTVNDFRAVEQSVARIGYSEQMGQMCSHMGAGAPGFTEMALKFHRTADTIADAAQKRDANAVLSALNQTLATCTSCHATFKQQVVDDSAWASLTQQHAPSAPMHP